MLKDSKIIMPAGGAIYLIQRKSSSLIFDKVAVSFPTKVGIKVFERRLLKGFSIVIQKLMEAFL